MAGILQFIASAVTARARIFLVSSMAFASGACAAAPPGPRGPLLGPAFQLAGDMSAAVSYAEAETPNGTRLRGTSDHYFSPVSTAPRRVELRLAPVAWADVGADVGWLDGGLDARFGVPDSPERIWAWSVASGVRSGKPGPFHDTKSTRSLWGRIEIYRYQRDTSDLVLVSKSASGEVGDGISIKASMSGDGRFLVFASTATNLVEGDTNEAEDILLFDSKHDSLERVSVAPDGTQADGDSWHPFISGNGRKVSFASKARNLLPAASTGDYQLYVRTLEHAP